MKKQMTIFLLFAILLVSLSSMTMENTVQAANTGGLSVSNSSVMQGDTFQVALTVPAGAITQKLCEVQFVIKFNNTVFEVIDYSIPAFVGGESQSYSTKEAANAKGELTASAIGQGGAENTIDFSAGISIIATCKVKSNAVAGDYTFQISEYTAGAIPEGGWMPDPYVPEGVVRTVTVTVKPMPVAVTGVMLNETNITLKEQGATATLVATVQPSNADNQNVTFSSSNPAVATVTNNGVITAMANGTTVITVTTSEGGKQATCTVTINIPHKHELQIINEVVSTCTVQGNNTYYYCTGCQKYYKDIEATRETTVEAEKREFASHVLTAHEAVNATHESAGNIAYWTCNNCGGYYSDLAATQPITASQVVIEVIGHSYTYKHDETNHWRYCDCGSEIDVTPHTFQWVVDKVATENATGLQHEECTVCGYKRNENTLIDKIVHHHTINKVDAKLATCTQDGNIEYYTCTSCNKMYEDVAGTKEITREVIVIKATGHGDTTMTNDSESHWDICTVSGCGAEIPGSKEPHIDSDENDSCDSCGAELMKETIKEEESSVEEESSIEEVSEESSIEEEDTSEESSEEESSEVISTEESTEEELEENESSSIDTESQEASSEIVEEESNIDITNDGNILGDMFNTLSWIWILGVVVICVIVIVVLFIINKKKQE